MQKQSGFNWFALLMFVMIAYFSTVLISQQVNLAHVSESQRNADKRLEKAKATNEKLRKELADLQDPKTIERLAREEYGFVKAGEMPYQPSRH